MKHPLFGEMNEEIGLIPREAYPPRAQNFEASAICLTLVHWLLKQVCWIEKIADPRVGREVVLSAVEA